MIIRLRLVTLSVFKILFIMDNQNQFNSELKTEYMEKKQNIRQSFSEKRTEYRQQQTIDSEIRVSLQECDISEDLRLNVLLNSTKSKFRFRSLLGLVSCFRLFGYKWVYFIR